MSSSERKILTELINLYKEFPCVWDHRHNQYNNNKEAKEHAMEVMLEKYRQLQDDATVTDLKRRIENMRTCYRREHKKVLLSRLRGDRPVHTPLLWYYNLMTFLNEVMDFRITQENENVIKVEYEERPPQPKKRKTIPSTLSNSVYLKDPIDNNDSEDDLEQVGSDMMQLSHETGEINTHESQDTTQHHIMSFNPSSESEAFGTTVGLQLKELDSIQKVFAEKLISDVIFNARLHRLTVNSNITL